MSPQRRPTEEVGITASTLCFEDRWIISRLNSTIRDYTKALESYEFSQAARLLYHFFWGDVCDWYLEIAKQRLYGKDNKERNL